ncbi:hypothetical protein [Cupriavidus plantarum]|uniref:hypothetical protein n=1 Tax=Cupriavidus plantarum TaxID=942865 RepID=UPI000EB23F1C|nr:hypothetical protein [Cupriavidus plantarum]RLK45937.1 hypothetical protein C7417_1967 [Cupriavidus plantarum]
MDEYGLQVWDENGNSVLKITDRITRFLGEFDTGAANGVFADGRLALGEPFISVRDARVFDSFTAAPKVYFNNGQIWWEFVFGITPRSVRIAYGIY